MSTLGKAMTWSFLLIGGYLLLSHYTGAGKLLTTAGSTAGGFAKVLQGRG